jgi:hypothetical protein
MGQGDRLRAAADLMDRVIFPPRGKRGENAARVAVACAVAHKAKVAALGYCPVKKAGRECWWCKYKLKLRRKR